MRLCEKQREEISLNERNGKRLLEEEVDKRSLDKESEEISTNDILQKKKRKCH